MGIYASPKLLKWFVDEYPKHSAKKLDMGKSCIRFKNPDDIPYKLIGELVSKVTVEKWIEFLNQVPENLKVYILGAPGDKTLGEKIRTTTSNKNVYNLCGELSFLQSVALQKDAKMNFVNDSAPMHLASATNAPVTAIFCSTVPAFGFGPLSDNSAIVESQSELPCRPCGLHGHTTCPEKHFLCARSINNSQLLIRINI